MQIVLRDIGEGLLSQRGLFIERISRAFVLIFLLVKPREKISQGEHPMQIFMMICFVPQASLDQGNVLFS